MSLISDYTLGGGNLPPGYGETGPIQSGDLPRLEGPPGPVQSPPLYEPLESPPSSPPLTGGPPSLPPPRGFDASGGLFIATSEGNAFLNCSAILDLFVMMSEIVSVMSKIQLAENLYKAKLALVQKDMAVAAANATKAAGEVAAAKEIAQAEKAWMDAALALTQVVITVLTFVVSKYEYNKKVHELEHPEGGVATKLTHEQKLQIQQSVDTQMRVASGALEGLMGMMKAFNEAAMHEKLAEYSIQEAVQRALSELLSKLLDIVTQTASMLGKSADTDCAKTIQSVLENFASYVRVYGEIGSK